MPAVLATMLLGALLWVAAWAVASPVGSSPDEPFHLAATWWYAPDATASRRIDPTTGAIESLIPTTVLASACFAFDPSQTGFCTMEIAPESVWWHVPERAPAGGALFYRILSFFVGRAVSPTAVFNAVAAMRIFNGILAIGLLAGVAYFLSRSGKRLLCYSVLAIASPMIIFLVASINPSGWAITGLLVAWFGAYAALRGRGVGEGGIAERGIADSGVAESGIVGRGIAERFVPALLAVMGAIMAANARTDSAVYLAAMAVAVVIMDWPNVRLNWWRLTLPLLFFAIGVFGFLAGGHAGVITEGVVGAVNVDGSALWPSWVLINNLFQLPEFLLRLPTPPLNWLDTELPQISEVSVSIAWVALALWGFAASKANWQKVIMLVGILVLLVLLPLYLFQVSGLLVGFEIQQRYMLPLLPILLSVALWRPRRDGAPRLSKGFTWLLYLAIVIGHAMALHTQIRRFTRGLDNYVTRFYTGPRLNVGVQWWLAPLSPDATWLLGSLGFALLALALFAVRMPRDQLVAADE